MSDNVYLGKSWRFERTLEDGSIDRLELVESFALLQYGGFGLPPIEWRTQPSLQGIGERVLDYQVASRTVTFEIASLDNASQIDLDMARLRLIEFAKPNQIEPVRVVVTRTDGRQFALRVRPLEAASFAGESIGPGFLEPTTWVAHDPIWFAPRPVIIQLPRVTRTNATSQFVVSSANRLANLTNMSSGDDLRFFWNFGDGTISVERNPVKRYDRDGSYRVRLTAYNGFSSDTRSRTVMVELRLMVPDAPDAPRSTVGNGFIQLRWMAPDSHGAPILSYRVRWRAQGDADFNEETVTRTEYIIRGLVNGRAYQIEVIATNSEGNSVASTLSTATPRTTPSRPARPTLERGINRITAFLNALPNGGGAAIHTSRVRYKLTSEGASGWISRTLTAREFSANETGGSITIIALQNGVSYDLQWQVETDAGLSDWSPSASIAPGAIPDRIAPPQFEAQAGSILASWAAPGDNGFPILDYRIRWATAAAPTTYLNPSGATGLTVTATSYTIPSLNVGVEYVVEIAARNSLGLGAFSIAAGETPVSVPARMSAPSLTVGYRSLLIGWTIPVSQADTGGLPVTNVDLEWRLGTSGDWTRIGALTGTSHRLESLTTNDTVQVRIRPRNRLGVAAQWSPAASATISGVPAPVAPPTLRRESNGIRVLWGTPDDGGSTLSSFDLRHKQSSLPDSDFITVTDILLNTYLIPNLTLGVAYDVQVRVLSTTAVGEWSETSTIVLATVPSQPTAPTLTRDGSQRVIVEWVYPAANGLPITTTDIEWVDPNSVTTTISDVVGLTQLLSGLTDGARIRVRVRVTNEVGDSQWSNYAAIVVGVLPDIPALPTVDAVDGHLDINWVLPSGNGLSIVDSDLQWRETGTTVWNTVEGLSGTSYRLVEPSEKVIYEFRVRSANAVGDSDWSSIARGSVAKLPGPVTSLRATVGSGYLFAQWVAPDSPARPILDYTVETTIDGNITRVAGVEATHFILDGLTNDVEVSITVEARSAVGLGEASGALVASPTQQDLSLMSFTPAANDVARFMVEITNVPEDPITAERELFNDDQFLVVGSLTGDATLPPEIDRIRFTEDFRLVFNRQEGDMNPFRVYREDNPGHELSLVYLQNDSERAYHFIGSVADAGGGGGFMYFEGFSTAHVTNIRNLTIGAKMVFVFGPANSVTLQNVRPDPPGTLGATSVGSSINVVYGVTDDLIAPTEWLVEYKLSTVTDWSAEIITASGTSGTHSLNALAAGTYQVRMRGRNAAGAGIASGEATATVS